MVDETAVRYWFEKKTLQWRHDECDGVSKPASNAENVSIWWRHQAASKFNKFIHSEWKRVCNAQER